MDSANPAAMDDPEAAFDVAALKQQIRDAVARRARPGPSPAAPDWPAGSSLSALRLHKVWQHFEEHYRRAVLRAPVGLEPPPTAGRFRGLLALPARLFFRLMRK